MATPILGLTGNVAGVGNGAPRWTQFNIGEPTAGKNRAIVVWANSLDSADVIDSMTVLNPLNQTQAVLLTKYTPSGNGTTNNLTLFVALNPPTNGSGVCQLTIPMSGDGNYGPGLFWAIVDDVKATGTWTVPVDPPATGNGVNIATSSLTCPAGGLLVGGMYHGSASSWTVGAGMTQALNGSYPRGYSVATRTTDGAFTWSAANASNAWHATAVAFAGDVAATGPTINTQPSNQSVVTPATATFTVAATASAGSLTYQWQREPAAGGGFTNISGATSASYTTGATSVSGGSHSNGDKYRCAVTDSNGTTNSSQATLTVGATPTRTITLTMTAADGTTTRPNLTSLKWAVWDVVTPDLITGAPAAKGTAESTDASGVMVITYTSSQSAGATAYLVVTDSNGDPAQSPAPKAFAGPVVLS